jgi:hypothetical protein
VIDAIQVVRLLAKPANVRPDQSPAGASRKLSVEIDIMIGKRGSAAVVSTLALKQFPVDMDRTGRTGGFMQIVNVLRTQEKRPGPA